MVSLLSINASLALHFILIVLSALTTQSALSVTSTLTLSSSTTPVLPAQMLFLNVPLALLQETNSFVFSVLLITFWILSHKFVTFAKITLMTVLNVNTTL